MWLDLMRNRCHMSICTHELSTNLRKVEKDRQEDSLDDDDDEA